MHEHVIEFSPAFDKRAPEAHKNYGIHSVDMRWYVKGPEGVVQFVVYTGWHLPHVQEELDNKFDRKFLHLHCHPQPADLGYHSPVQRYEHHSRMDCTLLPQGYCYYDGSGLNAERIFSILVEKGSDAVWDELENYYQSLFLQEEDNSWQ